MKKLIEDLKKEIFKWTGQALEYTPEFERIVKEFMLMYLQLKEIIEEK